MSLFGAKLCPLCGQEFKGLGTSCKDGTYCKDCYQKVHVLISDDTAAVMTLAAIRRRLDAGAKVLAAQAEKARPAACPVCGKKLGTLNSLELLDGYLCMNCASKASEELKLGYEELQRKRMAPVLAALRKREAQEARSGSVDAAALRILYPLLRTLEEDPGEGAYFDVYDDPLSELDDQTLAEAPARADALRAERHERYGRHASVFEVDDIKKKCRVSGGKRRYFDSYEVSGRVLLGEVRKGDALTLVRSDGRFVLTVSELRSMPESGGNKVLREGWEGVLTLPGKLSFLYPGDILFKD